MKINKCNVIPYKVFNFNNLWKKYFTVFDMFINCKFKLLYLSIYLPAHNGWNYYSVTYKCNETGTVFDNMAKSEIKSALPFNYKAISWYVASK